MKSPRQTLPDSGFRRVFRGWLGFDVRTAAVLLTLFGIGRVIVVLQADVTGRLDRVAGDDRHPAEANYSTLFAETKFPREKLPESR